MSGAIMTAVLFTAFILMVIILFLDKGKAFKDAEKIIFKEDNDAPITPRKSEAKL